MIMNIQNYKDQIMYLNQDATNKYVVLTKKWWYLGALWWWWGSKKTETAEW